VVSRLRIVAILAGLAPRGSARHKLFVAISTLLGMFVHPYFFWFTVFVGADLFQSAFTNWCPMMTFLRLAGVRDAEPSS
jgi:hypothetical protein